MDTIEIRRPDDFHVHLRQGALLEQLVPVTAATFGRGLVMPNLTPPILTGQQAHDYGAAIRQIAGARFEPLLTIKLTDATTPQIVHEARETHEVVAAKLYPVGVTTNSADGVSDVRALAPVFAEMERVGMILCLHAEKPGVTSLERESAFLDEHLFWLVESFPRLKIVVEHVSTAHAAGMIGLCGPNVAATITVHHLFITLDDVIGDKLQPHNFCKPIAKFEEDRQQLVKAAIMGARFFLGTDSAPHPKGAKECSACAAGCFTAPVALPLLAGLFEREGALARLEDFASTRGAAFYGLPPNVDRIKLVRETWTVPGEIAGVVPFAAGQKLNWKVVA